MVNVENRLGGAAEQKIEFSWKECQPNRMKKQFMQRIK